MYKPSKFKQNFDRWVVSYTEIVDGLIGFLTFGIMRANFTFKIILIQAKNNMKNRLRSK